MKIFLGLSLFTLLLLTSCAGMKEDWVAQNCNYNSAYEKGNNDRESGESMNSNSFASTCEGAQKQEALKGYREGYEKARQQETTAQTGTSIKIGGTQINIGNRNKKGFYCKVEAFTHKYDAFGETKLEAMKAAKAACTKDNNEMHCEEVRCVVNK